jgi:hypothetical protein
MKKNVGHENIVICPQNFFELGSLLNGERVLKRKQQMSYISKSIGIWILSQLSPWSTCRTFQRSLESGSFLNYHPGAHVLHFKGRWNLNPFLTITLEHMSYISQVWHMDPFSTTNITPEHVSYIYRVIGIWIPSQLTINLEHMSYIAKVNEICLDPFSTITLEYM